MTYQPKTYRTDGGDKQVVADGGTLDIESGGVFAIAGTTVTASAAEINKSSTTQKLTASGVVLQGISSLELNDATTSGAITATIADLTLMAGSLFIKDNSAGGTASKTVTAAIGTFDGTNNVLTFNAPKEAIMLFIDSAGNGTIIENVGEVALS